MKKLLFTIFFMGATLITGCGKQPVIDDAVNYPSKFSLIEKGYSTEIKSQKTGICWAMAASTSMESTHKVKTGQDIYIEPLDIVDIAFTENKQEGYFLNPGMDGKEVGGYAWNVVQSTSNGFLDYTLVDACDYHDTSIEEMKEGIMTKGAMNVAVNDAKSHRFGTFEGQYTLNDPDSNDFDHEVVLVGWDDNFPKDNFKVPASADGAWLAQNSHGSLWGTDGYYWISYDTPFEEETIYELSDEYDHVEYYDGGMSNTISVGKSTKVANVFHYTGALKAVGTYTTQQNQTLTIEIYDEDFKNKLYKSEILVKTKGYHVIPLDEPINVNDFAIAINYGDEAPVEGEAWHDVFFTYSVGINSGESYVYYKHKWLDLSEDETLNKVGLTQQLNNCCIKALY